MDYTDRVAGQSNNFFWFKGKIKMIEVLFGEVKKNKQLEILNVGAGTGDDLPALNKYGRVCVVDINKDALDLIPADLCAEKMVGDVCKLPYKDNTFDIVTAFDVVEHIDDDVMAVSEIHRVLKPGGKFLFSVPAFQFLFSSHDRALHHKRRYTKKNFKRLLNIFSGVRIYYWNFVSFFPALILRGLKKNSPAKVDSPSIPKVINSILYTFIVIDNILISVGLSPIIGLSLVGSANKPKNENK